MLRIVALNEEVNENDSEEEIAITQEAQETIAEAEYVRAIKLKANGNTDVALSLLLELLETKVLNEVPNDKNKILAIRYNCHKNIAIIYEETEDIEKAIQHYISAVNIDETDVYTLHRFGQLALRTNHLELSEEIFEKCLKRNPHHFSAADGLLRTYCQKGNVLSAYGLALKLYRLDSRNERAACTLHEVVTKFEHLLPLYKEMWNNLSLEEKEIEVLKKYSGHLRAFPLESKSKTNEIVERSPNLDEHRMDAETWLSIGLYIMNVYQYIYNTTESSFYTFHYEEIVKSQEQKLTDCLNRRQEVLEDHLKNINGNSNESEQASKTYMEPNPSPNSDVNMTNQLNDTNDDSDSNAKSDGNNDSNKSKARRRCSDLQFLEQWGWHKNRSRNSRKKSQPEKPDFDASLNGHLGRMFGKFKDFQFPNTWPFEDKTTGAIAEARKRLATKKQCDDCKIIKTVDEFQSDTIDKFEEFLKEIKGKNIDLLYLIYKWLKYISGFWDKCLPDEIKALYVDVYNLYVKHFDFKTWNHLPAHTFDYSYRICLLFLELQYENVFNNSGSLSIWTDTFHNLMFHSGDAYIIRTSTFHELNLRLLNLKFLWFYHRHQLDKSLTCLQVIENICRNRPDGFILHVPNVKNGCISKDFVSATRIMMERQISLEKVPLLYENEHWQELTEIIMNNIGYGNEENDSESWLRDFKVQVELLLESLFNLGRYDDCLIWAERCLQYFVGRYLTERKYSYPQRLLAPTINFIYSYIESIILREGYDILSNLNTELARMVQNIINMLCYHLDGQLDKAMMPLPNFDIKRPWVILHQVLLREESKTTKIVTEDPEDDDSLIPNSFLMLFVAHEFLGKRQWCTKDNGGFLHFILDSVSVNLRAPLYDPCRKYIIEYIEQVTYCLYGYPLKKGRSRHLEDHDAATGQLSFQSAVQIFYLFRPDPLPDINSYKVESISSDMENLILKIISYMPTIGMSSEKINAFISGKLNSVPDELPELKIPYKVNSMFYLMGDYYFKNRDFSKAIKYYTLDLAYFPTRFDSWAGLALSKGNKVETKLNDLLPLSLETIFTELEDVIRCFEQCITINEKQTLIWIEYGSFTYTIHSFCSRYLKYYSRDLSFKQFSFAEERKERMLNIAFNCFSFAAQLQNEAQDDPETHDERWLSQYMLGKIAEKRQLEPKIYLNHYLKAANHLYENSATYPIKINHNNPTTLSVEALELFYRTNAAIIKLLENKGKVNHPTAKLFRRVLYFLADSPFANNKAKIDGNTLYAIKRRMTDKVEASSPEAKIKKCEASEAVSTTQNSSTDEQNLRDQETEGKGVPEIAKDSDVPNSNSMRRESQESATGTATTTTTTSSAISSSDSSSSDDDSDSDSSECNKQNEKPCSPKHLQEIYQKVIQNLEECITRFPEHYKSMYRLIYHYLNGPETLCDLDRCEQLLLTQYKTGLGNQINGLFYDRKNNNIFNGIWRIPSPEIDRPGSFSAHLVKCVSILIQLLMKKGNHSLLLDVGLQLYRTPDSDKRYIKDNERLELYQQSITYCSQIIRNALKKNADAPNDIQLLDLMIEIYKIHKKCVKYMNQKEPLFTQLLIDVYKLFIKDKVVEYIPENLNYFDLAVKLCVQEINIQKNIEKSLPTAAGTSRPSISEFNNIIQAPLNANRLYQIPGLKQWLKINQTQLQMTPKKPMPTIPKVEKFVNIPPNLEAGVGSGLMSIMDQLKPLLPYLSSGHYKNSPAESKELQFLMECYKNLIEQNMNAPRTCTPFSYASALPSETTITPSYIQNANIQTVSPMTLQSPSLLSVQNNSKPSETESYAQTSAPISEKSIYFGTSTNAQIETTVATMSSDDRIVNQTDGMQKAKTALSTDYSGANISTPPTDITFKNRASIFAPSTLSAPVNLSGMDKSAISMTSVSTSNTFNCIPMDTKHCYAVPMDGVVKTLQQKLAERQKAHIQINKMSMQCDEIIEIPD